MGQVFKWEDVARKNVPQPEAFKAVMEDVRHRLAYEPSIVGAIMCGSVVRGDYTVRSDLDCVVLYEEVLQDDAFELMQSAAVDAASLHVPLVFIPCDTMLAQTRMHHLGGSFLRHLRQSVASGGLIKGNPLSAIAESIPEQEDLEAYLRVKMYSLQEAWGSARTFSEDRLVSYLKKVLEAPFHVARKVLAHCGLLDEDSKRYIRERYRERMPSALANRLEDLAEFDAVYTKELERQLDSLNERRYRKLLDAVFESSSDVLLFIRTNLALIAETAR
ncbi:MAG TPA: nucleotidyltransferase domain-containing protein [Candidatus Paceibacterota bacterium]|nr:nucleotidyltransferase domain-containing protein [Candidatus Paceibacterota bacterium]